MTPHADSPPLPLARVIPLHDPARAEARRGATSPDPTGAPAELAHAIDLLERRCGRRFAELPASLGRTAMRAQALIECGPTALGEGAPPSEASRAQPLVDAAGDLAVIVLEEADVLGEALSSALTDLPLDQLDEVVGAIIDLSLATRVEPAWASPASADAAAIVLTTVEAQLRAVARLHDELYAAFTDDVLEIHEPLLRAGDRPWRLVARARLRRRLREASRTGRLPGSLRTVARRVLEVRETRAELATLGPLLSTHLGDGAWRPLTDVDAVVGSLAAVRRCQRALGDRLVSDRLAALLAAHAFQSPDLVHPATALRTALVRWRLVVAGWGSGDPWALSAPALAAWATDTRVALPALTSGAHALAELGRPAPTLRDLVDDLLLRERADELARRGDDRGARAAARCAQPGGAS